MEALLTGPRRFNDLLDQLPGIAANILSERLKRLGHLRRDATTSAGMPTALAWYSSTASLLQSAETSPANYSARSAGKAR